MIAFRRNVLAALALAMAAGASQAGGLHIHVDADAADVGLPAYPGAVRKSDRGGDSSGFSFGVWGESFGLKVAVVSYRSVDGVDKVAAFYRDALGKYGPVLDCTNNRKRPDAPHRGGDEKDDRDQPVACDDDTIEAGGRLYKVGTNRSQHVVKVTPWHDGATFELVHVDQRGD
jgi:hypothetical protein